MKRNKCILSVLVLLGVLVLAGCGIGKLPVGDVGLEDIKVEKIR